MVEENNDHKLLLPAELVNIWLLVEVVAVLTDVVQLGVDGGIILAMAVFRHSSITLPVIIENEWINENPRYSSQIEFFLLQIAPSSIIH